MNKYDNTEFALVSMHSTNAIKGYLERFPEKDHTPGSIGCSATLVSLGEGKAVTSFFQEDKGMATGLVIDPRIASLQHADFMAYKSGSLVPEIVYENGIPGKNIHAFDQTKFFRNYAVYDEETGQILPPSFNLLYKNIIYKSQQRMTEAITQKESNLNPTSALMISIPALANKQNRQLTKEETEDMIEMSTKYNLPLIIYDRVNGKNCMYIIEKQADIASYLNDKNYQKNNELKLFKGFNEPPHGFKDLAAQYQEIIEQSNIFEDFEKLSKKDMLAFVSFSLKGQNPTIDAPWYNLALKYESLKNRPDVQNKQVFNEVIRRKIVNEIGKTDPNFFTEYNKTFNDLRLFSNFKTPAQYESARDEMRKFVDDRLFTETGQNLRQPQDRSCWQSIVNCFRPRDRSEDYRISLTRTRNLDSANTETKVTTSQPDRGRVRF